MTSIIVAVINLLRFLQLAIIGRVILSWIDPYPQQPLLRSYVQAIDALARPFKIVIPMGMVALDLGPLFLLLIIEALQQLLARSAFMFLL